MRKQLPVLFVCVALVLGTMGCSDSDVVPLPPTTQAALQTTQTIVTGVNLVTAIRAALAAPPASLDTGGSGSCNGVPIDVSKQVCTGGSGTASLCFDPLSIGATGCHVEGVGVVSGSAEANKSGEMLTLDLTIDETAIAGTITAVLNEGAGGFCQTADYDLEVMDLGTGAVAMISGIIEGCEDGSIFGEPVVDLPTLPATFKYLFEGSSATIDVCALGTENLVGLCIVDPLDSEPDCQDL
jgi:hypothetical protein